MSFLSFILFNALNLWDLYLIPLFHYFLPFNRNHMNLKLFTCFVTFHCTSRKYIFYSKILPKMGHTGAVIQEMFVTFSCIYQVFIRKYFTEVEVSSHEITSRWMDGWMAGQLDMMDRKLDIM